MAGTSSENPYILIDLSYNKLLIESLIKDKLLLKRQLEQSQSVSKRAIELLSNYESVIVSKGLSGLTYHFSNGIEETELPAAPTEAEKEAAANDHVKVLFTEVAATEIVSRGQNPFNLQPGRQSVPSTSTTSVSNNTTSTARAYSISSASSLGTTPESLREETFTPAKELNINKSTNSPSTHTTPNQRPPTENVSTSATKSYSSAKANSAMDSVRAKFSGAPSTSDLNEDDTPLSKLSATSSAEKVRQVGSVSAGGSTSETPVREKPAAIRNNSSSETPVSEASVPLNTSNKSPAISSINTPTRASNQVSTPSRPSAINTSQQPSSQQKRPSESQSIEAKRPKPSSPTLPTSSQLTKQQQQPRENFEEFSTASECVAFLRDSEFGRSVSLNFKQDNLYQSTTVLLDDIDFSFCLNNRILIAAQKKTDSVLQYHCHTCAKVILKGLVYQDGTAKITLLEMNHECTIGDIKYQLKRLWKSSADADEKMKFFEDFYKEFGLPLTKNLIYQYGLRKKSSSEITKQTTSFLERNKDLNEMLTQMTSCSSEQLVRLLSLYILRITDKDVNNDVLKEKAESQGLKFNYNTK